MAVHIGKGQLLEVVKGLNPQVPDNAIGDFVVDVVHEPLGQGCNGNRRHHAGNHRQQPLEIHLALAHNIVHPLAGEDGDIQRQPHGEHRQHQGENHQPGVGADILENALHDLGIFRPLGDGFLIH